MTHFVCPSLLATDEKETRSWAEKLDGKCDAFHIDVMDNQFVPNYTLERFAPPVIAALKTQTEKHVHLMTEIPSKYYNAYFEAGTSLITFHHEAVKNPNMELAAIHRFGLEAGVSLKPGTTPNVMDDYIHNVDFVLVMTVEPGFGGQSFMPSQLDKIRAIREKDSDIAIGVDGGINLETGRLCLEAGANWLIAGSAIFKTNDPVQTVEQFKGLRT